MDSRYLKHKRRAFESFFDFAEGKSLPEWPLEIFLEVSNICDLRCAMCPTFSALNPHRFRILRHRDRGVMSLEENVQPLEALLEHAPIVHAHGYGEPTIHPQFREFIGYLAEFEVAVDFFSNGMHFTEEMAEFLVEKRVSRVTISASGASKEEYENIYIGGTFETLLEGLDNIRRARERANSRFPRIDVNSIGFKHHLDNFSSFVRLMGEHGVNNVNLKPLATYDDIIELHPHRAEAGDPAVAEELQRARDVAAELGVMLSSKPFERFTAPPQPEEDEVAVVAVADLKDIANQPEKKVRAGQKGGQRKRDFDPDKLMTTVGGASCFEPFTTLYVSYGGDLFPCCFSRKNLEFASVENAADPWRAGGLDGVRRAALGNRYPVDLCAPCINKSAFPHHHNVDGVVRDYSKWFLEAFGVPFFSHIQQGGRALPDNAEILERWAGAAREAGAERTGS